MALTSNHQAQSARGKWRATGIAIFLFAALVLPLLLSPYHVFQWTMVVGYAVALLGLNILMGYNGQISLGHGAFYALGAYASGILIDHYGVPYFWTIPAAAVIGMLVGFLFGLPAVKLEGLYLALATFGLAVAVPQLLKYPAFDDWTGGTAGLSIAKPKVPLGLPITQDQWIYYLSLLVAFLMFWLAHNLLHGRIGRAMLAVRDHSVAASTMGINPVVLKALTFGVSAMYTTVAGALGTIAIQYASPDSFSLYLSIIFFVGAVVGGLATFTGPIFGAVFICFVPNLAEQVSKSAPGAIYGVLLILLVFFMPSGFAGGVRLLTAKFAKQKTTNIAIQKEKST